MKHLTPMRFALTLALLAAGLLAAAIFALAVGPSSVAPGEAWRALFARGAADPVVDIVQGIRRAPGRLQGWRGRIRPLSPGPTSGHRGSLDEGRRARVRPSGCERGFAFPSAGAQVRGRGG